MIKEIFGSAMYVMVKNFDQH